jgi:hypothetical protein
MACRSARGFPRVAREIVQQYVFGQLELFTVWRLLFHKKRASGPWKCTMRPRGEDFSRVAGTVQQYVFGRLELFTV